MGSKYFPSQSIVTILILIFHRPVPSLSHRVSEPWVPYHLVLMLWLSKRGNGKVQNTENTGLGHCRLLRKRTSEFNMAMCYTHLNPDSVASSCKVFLTTRFWINRSICLLTLTLTLTNRSDVFFDNRGTLLIDFCFWWFSVFLLTEPQVIAGGKICQLQVDKNKSTAAGCFKSYSFAVARYASYWWLILVLGTSTTRGCAQTLATQCRIVFTFLRWQ